MAVLLSFVIRVPTFADAAAIAAVHVDGWRGTYGHLLPKRFYNADVLERRTEMWTRFLSQDPIAPRLYVAESAGAVVGFAHVGSTQEDDAARSLTLYTLYVRDEFHGTGIGQALLDATAGTDPAQLWVAKANPRARAFYARNGFLPDGAEKIDRDTNDLEEIRLIR